MSDNLIQIIILAVFSVAIGAVEVSGDEASVEVSLEMEGEKTKGKIFLVKENGDWKVDLEKTDSEGEM